MDTLVQLLLKLVFSMDDYALESLLVVALFHTRSPQLVCKRILLEVLLKLLLDIVSILLLCLVVVPKVRH